MRSSTKLLRLEYQSLKRLKRINSEINQIISLPQNNHREIRARIAYCALELHGTWAHFSRSYFISAMLGCKTGTGIKIFSIHPLGTPITQIDEAIGTAISINTPKKAQNKPLVGPWPSRDEPSWHSTQIWLHLLKQTNCSGLTIIQNALSIPTTVFADLTKYRNYFAHRNEDTFKIAQKLAPSYGISSLIKPSEILISKPLGQPNTLLTQWTIDIEYVINLICS